MSPRRLGAHESESPISDRTGGGGAFLVYFGFSIFEFLLSNSSPRGLVLAAVLGPIFAKNCPKMPRLLFFINPLGQGEIRQRVAQETHPIQGRNSDAMRVED